MYTWQKIIPLIFLVGIIATFFFMYISGENFNDNHASVKHSEGIIDIRSEDEFKKEVIESDKPVFVKFYATWCRPCHMLSPIVDEISKQYKDKINFVEIDVDRNTKIANTYFVSNIPQVMFFKSGKRIDTLMGLRKKSDYINKINEITK